MGEYSIGVSQVQTPCILKARGTAITMYYMCMSLHMYFDLSTAGFFHFTACYILKRDGVLHHLSH